MVIFHSYVKLPEGSPQEMSQVRFAPCPGCLALSQDQRYAAYLARVQPHCGYQYQAPRCASGVWTRHWLPLVSSSRHWLSNGCPMLILIQLLSNGLPMVFQFSNGYPMVSQWIYLNIHGFPLVASPASCQAVHCALVQQVLLGAKASGQRVRCTRSLNLVKVIFHRLIHYRCRFVLLSDL